ncbi:MAG TPA: O-antigen ligase family protein [Candidatus Sulfotelmatobacter sp.]|nr:O-antigen ligase family protein [Candidatus Sulfotelmatobacter sp.]
MIGCIALIGADRVDLLAGHGFFRLTPFLLFAPLVLLIRLLLMGAGRGFKVGITPPLRRQVPYVALFALFLLISFASTLFGLNPERGIVSLCDLVLVSSLGYCISVRILSDPEPEKLIVRSVTVALVIWLVFCIASSIAWNQGFFRFQDEPASSIGSFFAPTATIFGLLPRLSGVSLDSNRAGFILVMYRVLIDRFAANTRYARFLRFTIGLFIVLTVSRSAILCYLTYLLFSTNVWMRLKTWRVALRVATIVLVCSFIGFVFRDEISGLLDLWQVSDVVSDRISGEQGTSGGEHIELIKRGLEIWSSSPRTMIGGIGFAGSPRFLSDIFGESKYGNFHSLYVSILAELGLPAFLLFMILLGYPMFGRKGAAACIAAIAVFNIALQSYMEPFFWMALALAWSLECKHRRALPLALLQPSLGAPLSTGERTPAGILPPHTLPETH